ncbi:MAG TPA: hypothetical protein CFH81_08700 [Sulfurovum sp. UBA12169]|nr:MAG TPA: hypothetical protein CFH81_08700 [Sulfurovum sp. UBA12169]
MPAPWMHLFAPGVRANQQTYFEGGVSPSQAADHGGTAVQIQVAALFLAMLFYPLPAMAGMPKPIKNREGGGRLGGAIKTI